MKATKEVKTKEPSQAEGLERFKELDRVIMAGLSQSLICARALREMEQGQYYTFGGFKTIAEYGLKTMKLAESTVHQYVHAGRVAKLIGDSTECRVKPLNEAQLRPLLSVKDESKVVEIWTAAETRYGKDGLTEKAVASAKRQVLKQDAPEAPALTAKQLEEKMRKALRSCWDAYPEDDRAALLGEVFLFAKGLSEELDKGIISPSLAAILVHINPKPEGEQDAKGVDKQPPQGKPKKAVEGGPSVPSQSRRRFDYWDHVNWRLHNRDIGAIWGIEPLTVRQTRFRKKWGPARQRDSETYQKDLEAEKAKAKTILHP